MSFKLNVLVSYAYWNDRIQNLLYENRHKINLLVDSGAFTAYNVGKEIILDDYCTFLDGLPMKPWAYFMLDVIRNPEATDKNYEIMLDKGYHPIPVVTTGADDDTLERYAQTTDFVSFGGITKISSKAGLAKINRLMKLTRQHGLQAHLLGFTKLEWLKLWSPKSCDSSTWLSGTRYGWIPLYMRNGTVHSIYCSRYEHLPKEVINVIRSYGIKPIRLKDRDNWKGPRCDALKLSIASWTQKMLDMETHLNTQLFLAVGSDNDLRLMIDAFDYLTGETDEY